MRNKTPQDERKETMKALDYEQGYYEGMAGQPCISSNGQDYEDGWFDGEADRPVMDDFVDPEKERTDPFGY